MNLIFWISKETIYCRITINGRRAEISTGLKAKKLRKGRTGDNITDTRLSEIEYKLRKVELMLSITGEPYDATDVKKSYESKVQKPKVYRLLDVMLDKDKVYKATTQHLKDFLGKSNPKLSELDQAFIDSFSNHLLNKVSTSSAKTYLSKVIASVGQFVEEVPFTMPNIKVEQDHSVKYLTLDQLVKLIRYEDSLHKQCFLWQIYTGMAMADVNNFDGKLDTMISGEKILRYNRVKTGVEGIIPSTKEIEALLHIFPVKLEERSYNKQLKVIGKAIGYDNLTSHVGRKTFGVLKLIDGYSMESVRKMLAHSSISLTEKVYAKVSIEKLFKEQRKIS